jgi:hypothetical protein
VEPQMFAASIEGSNRRSFDYDLAQKRANLRSK